MSLGYNPVGEAIEFFSGNPKENESEERQSYEDLSDEEMMEVGNAIMELIEAGKSAEDIVRGISENYGLEKDQALTEAVQEGIKFYPEVKGEGDELLPEV